MACFFVYAAVVQFNDPDTLVWVLLYATGAGITLATLSTRTKWWLPLPLGAVALIWCLTLLPGAAAVGFSVAEEVPREMFGLAIVAGWSLVLTLLRRRV